MSRFLTSRLSFLPRRKASSLLSLRKLKEGGWSPDGRRERFLLCRDSPNCFSQEVVSSLSSSFPRASSRCYSPTSLSSSSWSMISARLHQNLNHSTISPAEASSLSLSSSCVSASPSPAVCALHPHRLSPPRYSFFFSGFSTPQSPQKKARGISIVFVAVVFLMPTICVYFGSSPSLLNWWMASYRLVEYSPQADPRIIPAIFFDKPPPAKSEDSDIHTNR